MFMPSFLLLLLLLLLLLIDDDDDMLCYIMLYCSRTFKTSFSHVAHEAAVMTISILLYVYVPVFVGTSFVLVGDRGTWV